MITKVVYFFLLSFIFTAVVFAADKSKQVETQLEELSEPVFHPILERYILDDLKQLRVDQHKLRTDFEEKVANSKLNSADRAIKYTADTTNNIFYIITATASIIVLLGWKSLSDMKANVENITTKTLADLTRKYEKRLDDMEEHLKKRSKEIIEAQEEISNTNLVHSLWMRAGLEKGIQDKISLYDQILEINPEDIEALTYKADALLDLDEIKWALSLIDQALELDDEYAQAYWQRACAFASLNKPKEAILDLKKAIELSDSLIEELDKEHFLAPLKADPEFLALFAKE
jgi:tetratricopeptide (TPR) repeat protein